MSETFVLSDILAWLAPLLVPVWIWGVLRVLRDLRQATPPSSQTARCGETSGPAEPAPLMLLLHRWPPRRAAMRLGQAVQGGR